MENIAPVPPDENNVYRSTVLTHFWLKTDWLWQTPSPAIEGLLLKIGGAAYKAYLLNQIDAAE